MQKSDLWRFRVQFYFLSTRQKKCNSTGRICQKTFGKSKKVWYYIGMKEMKQIIANNIIKLRKENKLTQAELAQKLNYSDKAISKWERAESIPDIEILKKIGDMFGVTVDYLITEDAELSKDKFKLPQKNRAKQISIILLGITLAWLVATIVFVYASINFEYTLWTAFVWAVPISCVVYLVFYKKWGVGNKISELIANTLLCWSLLASIYVQFLSYNLWLIFFIGLPIQVVIVLWSNIKSIK